MDDLETSSYIHTYKSRCTNVRFSSVSWFTTNQKILPYITLSLKFACISLLYISDADFCRCPDSLQQVWNMERGPVCLVLMDHFVKISSFRYVLSACWLSCSLLVSVFFFPSLCFLFVDDCWLVIAFSNRYRYLLSLWIVLQLFHSYADFRWDRGNFSWRCFVLNELWPFCCVCCCLIRMFIDPCF